MSPAIQRLVALSTDAGVTPVRTSDADGVAYRSDRHMPDVVREAGLNDPDLGYLRSADDDAPDEGFIDEATETYLFYPLDPAHDLLGDVVAARTASPRKHPLLAGITGLVGLGMIGRSLLHPDGFMIVRVGTGALLVACAVLLFRRRAAPKIEK